MKRGEYEEAVSRAVQRLLRLAGTGGERWAALVEALPNLGSAEHTSILDGLNRLDVNALTDVARRAI